MPTRAAVAIVALLAVTCASSPAGPDPKTEDEKTIYALGLALSRNLAQFNLTPAELELVKAGITDGVLGKDKKVDLDTYGPKLQELAKTRAAAGATRVWGRPAAGGFMAHGRAPRAWGRCRP